MLRLNIWGIDIMLFFLRNERNSRARIGNNTFDPCPFSIKLLVVPSCNARDEEGQHPSLRMNLVIPDVDVKYRTVVLANTCPSSVRKGRERRDIQAIVEVATV